MNRGMVLMRKTITSRRKAMVLCAGVLVCLLCGGCPAEEPVEPERKVRLAANEHFIIEEEGLNLLEEEYGLIFDEIHEMAVGLTHEALKMGDVDVAVGFTTDGKIKELELVKLKDDQKVFPVSNPAPLVRENVLEQYPQIEAIMAEISSRLDNQTMIELNYQVDLEENEPVDVARKWLLEEELITKKDRIPLDGDVVVVGSKEFVEQNILGQIATLALEDAGIPVEKKEPIAGTEAIRRAILLEGIDLYWEYTGVAWQEVYEKEERLCDPEQVFKKVSEKDAKIGLTWLDYAPLNKTYTLMMRREDAISYEIDSISDLSKWTEQVRAGESQ